MLLEFRGKVGAEHLVVLLNPIQLIEPSSPVECEERSGVFLGKREAIEIERPLGREETDR